MKYLKQYEQVQPAKVWLVKIDQYFEVSLRKIDMDENEIKRWLYNFTNNVSKPKTDEILVMLSRFGGYSWDDVPPKFEEVILTPKEKEQYDLEINAKKYNL